MGATFKKIKWPEQLNVEKASLGKQLESRHSNFICIKLEECCLSLARFYFMDIEYTNA